MIERVRLMTAEVQTDQVEAVRKRVEKGKAIEPKPSTHHHINLWDERAAKGDRWYRIRLLRREQDK